MSRPIIVAAVSALGLALAGCAAQPRNLSPANNTSLYSLHQPVVEHTNFVFDVATREDGVPVPRHEPIRDWNACNASFSRAREVYPHHHTARCTSWLLDPQLAEALPPTSNIVRFQRRFELRDEGREANDDVLRFVFHTYDRDLDGLKPRTTLERALVERMRAGGSWRAPAGVTSLR